MKYLGVFFFITLLGCTWYITNSQAAVSLETHIGIQTKLATLITETVKAKKPQATAVQIDQLWTEPVPGTDSTVKAHFSYRFKEPGSDGSFTESTITGEGILVEQASDESGLDRWSLKDVKTTNDSVTFEQPMLIKTGASDVPGDDAPPATDPAQSGVPTSVPPTGSEIH